MGMTPGAADGPLRSGMSHVVECDIQALLARRRREEQQANWQDRLAARITAFTASLRFVYLHLGILGLWVVVNVRGYLCRTSTRRW